MKPIEYAHTIAKIREAEVIVSNVLRSLALKEVKDKELKRLKEQREKVLEEIEKLSNEVTNHFVKVQHNGRH